MITITIEAENAAQAREEMRALLGQDRETAAPVVADGGAEDKAQPGKPKATRSTKAKKDDASATTATTAATAEDQAGSTATENSEPATAEDATSATTNDRDLSEKAMRERITLYSAKAGPVALTEMQKNAGAPNGKFSEIMANPDFVAELDRQLTALGF